MTFQPFEAAHLETLCLTSEIELLKPLVDDEEYRANLALHSAIAETGLWRGKIVACAGILPYWPGRAEAWALIGEVPRRQWPAITARTRAGLDKAHAAGFHRIETFVRLGFKEAHLWARHLGFEPVAPKPLWGPDGATFWEYARLDR